MSDVAYNAGLEIRYAIAASGVDPIQHIPEVDAIIERRLAEARKGAFIEAAEIASGVASRLVGPVKIGPAAAAAMEIAATLRGKAEETRT